MSTFDRKSDFSEIFASFKSFLENVQKTREEIENVVKALEQLAREIITVLQGVHDVDGKQKVSSSCMRCRKIIENDVKREFRQLDRILGTGSASRYYEYHDIWKFVSQRLSFAVAFIAYLEAGELADHEDVAKTLGIHSKREEGFHLDLEDYLAGLLQLSSELSRLAVNSVVYKDYGRPLDISQFVIRLNAGFQLLNFKNDSLRRRFDGLKYDVKKIEEVVYDLSIRGLTPGNESEQSDERGVTLEL